MGLNAYKIIVHGRVQGVFFRYNTKEFCNSNKIIGTVKNNIDGTVELNILADEKQIETVRKFIKNNPGRSSISNFEIEIIEDSKIKAELNNLNEFKIVG